MSENLYDKCNKWSEWRIGTDISNFKNKPGVRIVAEELHYT